MRSTQLLVKLGKFDRWFFLIIFIYLFIFLTHRPCTAMFRYSLAFFWIYYHHQKLLFTQVSQKVTEIEWICRWICEFPLYNCEKMQITLTVLEPFDLFSLDVFAHISIESFLYYSFLQAISKTLPGNRMSFHLTVSISNSDFPLR